jgi:ureidoglycolate lyase/2,4-diketo-3-deoxy-L-fuconate hydrolase
MKFLRYGPVGQERPGVLDAAGNIRDLSAHVKDFDRRTITLEGLEKLKALNVESLSIVPKGARIGACVGDIGKVVAIGLNYTDHAKEANLPIPKEPIIFAKPTSSISGPYDDVQMPPGAEKMDWEVELGIVIGKTAKHVSKDKALDYVAGYCLCNDVSERAYQMERGGTWDKGKGYDTFCPLGPWLVTKDEVNAQALSIWLEVDGKRYQDGNTANMIFDIATMVSYVSDFMSLQPGDVIITGTPAGVGLGQKPNPVFLKLGQTMKLGATGLGEQKQKVVKA